MYFKTIRRKLGELIFTDPVKIIFFVIIAVEVVALCIIPFEHIERHFGLAICKEKETSIFGKGGISISYHLVDEDGNELSISGTVYNALELPECGK